MATRIALNGCGRVGRRLLALLARREGALRDIEIAGLCEVAAVDQLAWLLRGDSLYGRAGFEVRTTRSRPGGGPDDALVLAGAVIPWIPAHNHPSELPWAQHRVEVVIESTGRFSRSDAVLGHLAAGAGRVLVAGACAQADSLAVAGVSVPGPGREHRVIATGMALTNALAPVFLTLGSAGVTVEAASVTLLQCLGATGAVQDRPVKRAFREGRGFRNLIPSSHGAGGELGKVLPELRGRVRATAWLVPVPGVCAAHLVVRTREAYSRETIAAILEHEGGPRFPGILATTREPLVSSDLLGDPRCATITLEDISAATPHLFGVPLFYDPETATASRLLTLLEQLGRIRS